LKTIAGETALQGPKVRVKVAPRSLALVEIGGSSGGAGQGSR